MEAQELLQRLQEPLCIMLEAAVVAPGTLMVVKVEELVDLVWEVMEA